MLNFIFSLGEQVLSTSSICHMNHTKAIGALMNINGQQVKIIGLILYMDAQYIIQAAIDPSQNQSTLMNNFLRFGSGIYSIT